MTMVKTVQWYFQVLFFTLYHQLYSNAVPAREEFTFKKSLFDTIDIVNVEKRNFSENGEGNDL